jgi:hypothetical protein
MRFHDNPKAHIFQVSMVGSTYGARLYLSLPLLRENAGPNTWEKRKAARAGRLMKSSAEGKKRP